MHTGIVILILRFKIQNLDASVTIQKSSAMSLL